MRLNLIKACKTQIYNAKQTPNTQIHFQKSIFPKINIFPKNKFIKTSVFRLFSWPAFGRPKNLVYTTKNPPKSQKMISTKIVHTSGIVFDVFETNAQQYIQLMFPYTVKYTESDSDIQNNNLLYKKIHHAKIILIFGVFEHLEKFQTFQTFIS